MHCTRMNPNLTSSVRRVPCRTAVVCVQYWDTVGRVAGTEVPRYSKDRLRAGSTPAFDTVRYTVSKYRFSLLF